MGTDKLRVESGRVYPVQQIDCNGCERTIRYNVTEKRIRTCKSCRTDNPVKYKQY